MPERGEFIPQQEVVQPDVSPRDYQNEDHADKSLVKSSKGQTGRILRRKIKELGGTKGSSWKEENFTPTPESHKDQIVTPKGANKFRKWFDEHLRKNSD